MSHGSSSIEACFFGSLTCASHCHKHKYKRQIHRSPRTPTPSSATEHTLAKKSITYGHSIHRRQHTKTYLSSKAPFSPDGPAHLLGEQAEYNESIRTREELLALVDQYEGYTSEDHIPLSELHRKYQPSDGPHLTVSDKEVDEWPPPFKEWPADADTKEKLYDLETMLGVRTTDPEIIYQLYKDLPQPRAPYLSAPVRHKLLHHLSIIERKNEQSMLRYFSVLNDMKSTAIPLNISEWNSAVSFAARWVYRSTETELEAAMYVWREMEHVAGVKGNEVTFNILFDVACKAGKYTLADMLYKGMLDRGLPETRFTHVSLMYFNGLKEDGDGVRAAFKALENAGQIIDTVVLNCLIASFIRCNEASQAEQIYEFMKRKASIEQRPKTYLEQRNLTETYQTWAHIVKQSPDRYVEYQARSSMGPDKHTYHILFNTFGVETGDLEKIAVFLDELIELQIPIDGSHFLAFFKGFAGHGGIRYTKWTEDLLERTWSIFMTALEENEDDRHLYISKWMVLWSLRAFAKCVGKARMIEIWEGMRDRWNPSQDELDWILPYLGELMDMRDMALLRQSWVLGTGSK
ncbi:hypothetical protein BJ878DRAFT_536803 [Calycina marina]|uniref:Pentatricopeptide repeat-containing protein n=1 Tax=Calycina marina TaxID=1763456 RepID=A0A9P7YVX7_9HELO|nr:hypothetical protein BJ878DRAFT_536803 [Calycina marina]